MKLAQLKNPYHTPGVAGLHRPGIFPNPFRRRKRRNALPAPVFASVPKLVFGIGLRCAVAGAGGYAIQGHLLKDAPVWGKFAVAAGGGAVLAMAPRTLFLDSGSYAALGGALWYGAIDSWLHKVAVDSTSAFFSSMR